MTMPPVVFPKPTKQDYLRVLTATNSNNPFCGLLEGIVSGGIQISELTLDFLLEEAERLNLGYRGLHQACNRVLVESLSELMSGNRLI